MKWIETIELRTYDRDRSLIESRLRDFMHEVGRKTGQKLNIRVYRRALIESDFCVSIMHESEKVESLGSTLGLRLISALQEFGLVHHRVWVTLH